MLPVPLQRHRPPTALATESGDGERRHIRLPPRTPYAGPATAVRSRDAIVEDGPMADDIAAGSPASDGLSPAGEYVGDPAVQAMWDGRCTDRGQLWSGQSNGALVAEVAELTPGRVLDCPVDPRASGLGSLGLLDPAHPVFAVAVGERVEEPARGRHRRARRADRPGTVTSRGSVGHLRRPREPWSTVPTNNSETAQLNRRGGLPTRRGTTDSGGSGGGCWAVPGFGGRRIRQLPVVGRRRRGGRCLHRLRGLDRDVVGDRRRADQSRFAGDQRPGQDL